MGFCLFNHCTSQGFDSIQINLYCYINIFAFRAIKCVNFVSFKVVSRAICLTPMEIL